MQILFTGGGTLGSVVPLLAIHEILKRHPLVRDYQPLWIGTRSGQERKLLEDLSHIPFKSILNGKLRRYFSWRNFLSPFLVLIGLLESFIIILRSKPDIILSAGSFVSVPVVWAGWILRVPSLIHQQDVEPGLANRLMAPLARMITVTFKESGKVFPARKTVWTGNPVRGEILEGDEKQARQLFSLESYLPTILVLGGSSGALELNKIVIQALEGLTKFCQVIHVTGQGVHSLECKSGYRLKSELQKLEGNSYYHPYEFLTHELKHAYKVADLVISRSGMSTLSELSLLGKPAILVPLPGTHQEKNTRLFKEKEAAIVVEEKDLSVRVLVEMVRKLLKDSHKRKQLSENIRKMNRKDAAEEIIKEILKIIDIDSLKCKT